MWNVSKTTINRYISILDAEYIKQHTHIARNKTFIDAEMYQRLYQIYNQEAIQTETEKLQQVEISKQIGTDDTEILEKMLQQFETKLQYFETLQHSAETLLKHLETENEYLKSQIENKDKELQNLKQEYISQLQELKQEYISQLTVKDNQIQDLNNRLEQNQILLAMNMKQIESKNEDDLTEHKGFFARIFGKGK